MTKIRARVVRLTLVAATFLLMLPGGSASAYQRPGTVHLVSRAAGGEPPNGTSGAFGLSRDGRFVVFTSAATNLVPNDQNGVQDVFVKDLATGAVDLVSVSSSGQQTTDLTSLPVMDPTGRFVAFTAYEPLDPRDRTDAGDIYLHDRVTRTTELVTISLDGDAADNHSRATSISAGGRYVVFDSFADDLVEGDTNGWGDVFLRDRALGVTERVSLAADGSQLGGDSLDGHITDDGRYVSYTSLTWPVPGPPEAQLSDSMDVFVRDRSTGAVEHISATHDGAIGNGWSSLSTITGDGRSVAFRSAATNLVPNDTNNQTDVFVRDRLTGVLERVSLDSSGAELVHAAGQPSISDDGRYVAFFTIKTQPGPYVPGPPTPVWIHDRASHVTERVDVASDGSPADGSSVRPLLARDGRLVTFTSAAGNLVADASTGRQVYMRDRGPERGIVGIDAVPSSGGSQVSGSATFGASAVAAADDPTEETDPVGYVDLVKAQVLYRVESEDLFARLFVRHLPVVGAARAPGTGTACLTQCVHSHALAPATLYELDLTAGARQISITAERDVNGPRVQLRVCEGDGSCDDPVVLTGGIGARGNVIEFAVPLALIGVTPGDRLRGLTALASAPHAEDSLMLGDAFIPVPEVELASSDATWRLPTIGGWFSGTLDGAEPPVRARACLGADCGGWR